jgi:molybdopterin molybdotransferase
MDFVDVNSARTLLMANIMERDIIDVPLLNAQFLYTATDVYAPIDVPSFDNSAMDGYCFLYEDFKKGLALKIAYTIQAGDLNLPKLKSGEAARIFTGAPIPEGADTVVMQEKTIVENGLLKITDAEIKAASNVRARATQSKQGEKIVSKNTLIHAGLIGFLATFGIKKLAVFESPKIGILVTGKELVQNDKRLEYGEIYESNSASLKALLKEMHLEIAALEIVDDEPALIRNKIKTLLEKVDLLIITGGISVGEFDFVKEALAANEVEKIFYKVQQKPGKPMFFGVKKLQRIFALPGNPAATFTCFHQYVKPFIELCLGAKNVFDNTQTGVLNHDYFKKGTLTNFVKAHVSSGTIRILDGQESYKMQAFQQANCIVELAADQSTFSKGDSLTYRMI